MGLALLAPSAFAHGNQFICARVTVGDDGRVALELTADYGDNPNIADALEARRVLRECLRLQRGERVVSLEQLGQLRFVEHDRYAPDSPIAKSAIPEEGPHRLMTASWETRLPGERVHFLAKQHTPFDVVMWQAGTALTAGGSRWVMLIAGDRSPEFTIAARPTPWWSIAFIVIAAMICGWYVIRRWRLPEKQAVPASADKLSADLQQDSHV